MPSEPTSDLNRGLYRKYHVERLNDPDGKHDHCRYFVLDPKHDKHARVAVLAYADSCETEYPYLADDLRARTRITEAYEDGTVERAADWGPDGIPAKR